MTKEVETYFLKEYEQCPIKVVPGHWPDFKTKEEVDKWINFISDMMKYVQKRRGTHEQIQQDR